MPPIMQEISRRETVFYRYPWLRYIGLLWPVYRKGSEGLNKKGLSPLRRCAIRRMLLIIEYGTLAIAGASGQELEACVSEWVTLDAEHQEAAQSLAKSLFRWVYDKGLWDPWVLFYHYSDRVPGKEAPGSGALFGKAYKVLLREAERRRILESKEEG